MKSHGTFKQQQMQRKANVAHIQNSKCASPDGLKGMTNTKVNYQGDSAKSHEHDILIRRENTHDISPQYGGGRQRGPAGKLIPKPH